MQFFKGGVLALLTFFSVFFADKASAQVAPPPFEDLAIYQRVTSIDGVPVSDGGATDAAVGSTVEFTATIENRFDVAGVGLATINTQVRELFSGPYNLISAVPSQGSCPTITTPASNVTEVECDLGVISAFGTATIVFTGVVEADGQIDKIGTVQDFFPINLGQTTVNLPIADLNPLDNVAVASVVGGTAASAPANLVISKIADNLTPVVGVDTVTWGVAVLNLSGVPVSNIIVTDVTFGDVTMGTAAGAGWICASFLGYPVSNYQYCIHPGAVAPGAATAPIFVTGTPNVAGPIANIASATPLGFTEVLPTDNSAVVTVMAVDQPAPVADLSITKSVSDSNPSPGDTVTFNVTVTNSSGATANNVVVTDKISGPLDLVPGSLPAFCSAVASPDANVDIIRCMGNLGAGTFAFSYQAQVPVGGFGQTDNIACISSADVSDPDLSNNCAVSSTVVLDVDDPAADLRITKSVVSTLTPAIGDTVEFEFRVRNQSATETIPAGAARVTDITVGAILMDNVQASGAWTCAPAAVQPGANPPIPPGNSRVMTCTNNNSIPPNTTQQFRINGTVVAPGGPITNTATVIPIGFFDNDLSNNTESVTLLASTDVASADISVTKEFTGTAATVGAGNAQFTVTVRNNGPEIAPIGSVQLADITTGPIANLSFASGQFNCALNAANPKQVDCTSNVALGVAATGTVVITGDIVAGGITDQIDNVASVSSPLLNDANLSNNTAMASVIRGSNLVDLSITKSVDLPQSEVGDTVTYTLNVTNNSAVSATNATVTDIVSGPITMNAASVTAAGCSIVSTNPPVTVIACDLNALAPGAAAPISYQGTVTALGQVDNIASIDDLADGATPATVDPNTSNNSSVASTVVGDPALPTTDVQVWKEVTSVGTDVGDPIEFTVHVRNNGPAAIPVGALQITDITSGPITLPLSTTGSGCVVSAVNPRQIDCSAFGVALAAGAETTFTVSGVIGGTQQIDNVVTVSSTQFNDSNLSNNTAVASVNGTAPVQFSDLRLLKSASASQVQAGDSVTFTVSVTNLNTQPGAVSATNYRMVDTIVGDFTLTSVLPPQCSLSAPAPGIQAITCNVPNINVGATQTLTYTGTLNSQGVATNTASVSMTSASSSVDPAASNNTVAVSVLAVATVCGDGIQEGFEQCDDGNTTPGDGCSDICQYEAVCGDGLQEGLEQCDDGNTVPGDGCDDICRLETVCGDNLQQGLEECDDGNTAGGDGCDEFCRLEGADLSVVKAVDRAQATIGDTVTFTLTVTNSGPRDATNVVVTDQLVTGPNTFTITAITPSTGSCTPAVPAVAGSVVISCNLGSMDASDVETITVVGTVDGLGQIDNTASVADTNDPQGSGQAQVDPNPSNNVSVASVNGTAANMDLSITKTSSLAQANQDQDVTFTITVNNPGAANAQGVVITDTIDGPFTINTINFAAGTCVPATPVASPATIVCTPTGGVLPPGATTITMTGRISAEGQVDNTVSVDSTITNDSNQSNNTAVASVIGIARNTDLSVTKTVDFPQATVGDTVTFTVVVTNLDTVNNAEGVRITDIATGPMEVQSMAFTGVIAGTCTPSAALPASAMPFLTFVCIPTAGEIGPGGDVEITMTAIVTGEGQIDNTVSADVTITHDNDQSNNTAVSSVNGAALADLRVTKTVTNGPIFNIGDTVSFDIEIENRGPNDATNVTLTDMQLGGLSFDAPPAGCAVAGNNMTCDVTPLLTSGSTITVSYTSTANVAGLWSNIVTVSSDVEDRIMSNNTTSANVSVGILADTADLEVTKTADVSEITQGGDVNYTITVTNNGPDEATDVVLNDFIAGPFDSVSNIQINPLVGTCSELNGLLTCAVPSVPSTPGFNTFTVTYTVTTDASGAISNLAVVAGAVSDPIQENNSAAYQVNVVDASADVSISKVVNPNPGLVGDTFTYTLLVKNAGPDTARNVIAVDQISGQFDDVTANSSMGSCTVASAQAGTSTVTCELGDMTSGSQATITISVTGDGLFSILSNLASAYSDTHDPVLGNNAATADTIQLEGPSPTNQPILEGSGIHAGGCSMSEAPTQSAPWAIFLAIAAVAALAIRGRKRFQ